MSEPAWPYFPVFLELKDQAVLVVGGGEVAARKIRLLLRAGARIRLVAPEREEEVEIWLAGGAIELAGEAFDAAQLEGCRLCIAATDDREVNRAVVAAARQQGVLANAVDDPSVSDWVTPSIVDRNPLLVAIGTAGHAPVLGRRLRERLETEIPAAWGRVAAYMGEQRARVQAEVPVERRRALWEAFLDGPGAEAVLNQDPATADAELQRLIDDRPQSGEVWLVGAGPGDPDLLTLRALRLMQSCDVVLYDALIPPAIMERVRRDAQRVYVGKRRARHTLPQEDINTELVRYAKQGLRVLRLKGGDPFVFGRGGEEIAELFEHGIPFQVVPGITAANGCAAYAGIPLTHRDHAQSVTFVTGHARADGTLELNWSALTLPGQTVVIYMGLSSLPTLCSRLIEHGASPQCPAAVIESGTSPAQRVHTGTLTDLPGKIENIAIEGPALVVVGTVVTLRDRLQWHGERKTR